VYYTGVMRWYWDAYIDLIGYDRWLVVGFKR
jgi:hypothetical protein